MRASFPRGRRLAATTAAALAAVAIVGAAGTASGAGRAWRVSAEFPPPIAHVEGVACGSATVCVAVGYSTDALGLNPRPIELRTTDAGAQWLAVSTPTAVPSLDAVACVGSLCLAGGNGVDLLRSTDGGATWTPVALPGSLADVTAIACPTATACFLAGAGSGSGVSGELAGSTDGGATWTSQYGESSAYLQSLWCLSSTSCFAYGDGFVATTDGATWSAFSAPVNFPTLAVCPAAATCVGSSPASGIVVSDDGGSTWSMSDGDVVPTAIACGSATSCVGTDGTNVVSTTDGGSDWGESSPGYTDQLLSAVACTSATDCQVVGTDTADGYADRALLLDADPADQSLGPERVNDAIDVALGASCPASTVCYVAAVDPYTNPVVLKTTNGGASWTDLVVPPALGIIDAIRCTSPTACLVAGGDLDGYGAVWRTTNGGGTWALGGVPASVGEVDALECLTATRCEAVGYLTNSWTAALSSGNGGRSWSVTPLPHTATNLFGVDCPTATTCVAVGGRNGAVGVAFYSSTAGRTWRPARVLGGLRALNDVSCLTTTICVAGSEVRVGATPHGAMARTTDGGAVWTPVLAPGRTSNLFSVSCYSASSCEAVGQTTGALQASNPNGAAAIATANQGRSWTTQALPAEQWALFAVGCARAGACVAAGVGSFDEPNLPTGATVLRYG